MLHAYVINSDPYLSCFIQHTTFLICNMYTLIIYYTYFKYNSINCTSMKMIVLYQDRYCLHKTWHFIVII